MQDNQSIAIRCDKCSYKWKYGGRRKFFATCPQCMRQVKLPSKQ